MPTATLSRWTMSYFAAGLVLLIVAEGLVVAGVGYPAAGLGDPSTLMIVHLVVLGWLSLVMAGALQQFVPVLVVRPLAFPHLALPALLLLLVGLGLLLAGFAALGGIIEAPVELMLLAAPLLILGIALLALMLAATILAERPVTLTAQFVLVGLACLLLTVLSGSGFAALLSGLSGGLGAGLLLPAGRDLHMLLGLGGWLGLIAFGVGYRLYAMFMLTPETPPARMRAVLGCACIALLPAVAGLALLLVGHDITAAVVPLSVCGFALASLLHGRDLLALYRNRRRKQLEINMLASLLAFAALAVGMSLLPTALILDAGESLRVALVFLLVFGWLSGLTLSQLVKIVAFLTWIETFAPRIGRGHVPRVGDLVSEARLLPCFTLYFAGVAAGTLALALMNGTAFRVAMALCLTGCLGVAVELVRVRRLAGIDSGQRPPAESCPRLFLPPRSNRRSAHVASPLAPARDHRDA